MFTEKEKTMSHPDPLFDPDNAYEDDMNYDDYNDFNEMVEDGADDLWYGDIDLAYGEVDADELEDSWDDSYDDSMDGDMESGLASAGWGTDEDYGYYGDDE
jgi:hypothetical protein